MFLYFATDYGATGPTRGLFRPQSPYAVAPECSLGDDGDGGSRPDAGIPRPRRRPALGTERKVERTVVHQAPAYKSVPVLTPVDQRKADAKAERELKNGRQVGTVPVRPAYV